MEENSEIQEDLGNGGKFKNWLQDNIRIILSVLIVATIAAGIYSYSKRTVVPVDQISNDTEVNLAEANKNDDGNKDNNAVVVVGEDENENKTEKTDNNSKELSVKEENQSADVNKDKKEEKVVTPKEKEKPVVEEKKEEKQPVASGEETETSFVEVANNGDSLTTLARRATKQYLEKNPVDGLTKEHKIYIEDYLRRHINHSTIVRSGEQISFSKDLIKNAIGASKNLNERQLKNLQKYSARVSGL
jgi:hypothetical protein